MDYYVYIDESGSFEKDDSYKSIVGGIISINPISDYKVKLEDTIAELNKTFNVDFTLKDIHIAALLHPKRAFKPREKERFSSIAFEARTAFALACLEIVDNYSEKFIYSVNDYFKFGSENPQNCYGQVLSALVHEIISFIQLQENVDSLNLFIAPRSEKCLNANIQAYIYHEELVKYITELMIQKLQDIKISVKSNLKHEDNLQFHNLGYDFADVACYYLRQYLNNKQSENKILEEKIIRTKPNDISAQHYDYHNNILYKKLITNHALESAYRIFELKRNAIIKRLDEIKNIEILNQQLTKFSALAEELIEKRTIEHDALENAKEIFEKLAEISVNKFSLVPEKEKGRFLRIYLNAVKGSITCENHTGLINNQKEFEKYISNAISKFGKYLTDETTISRQELILQIKNSAYNDYANNYRFKDVIDEFKIIVDERFEKGFDDDLTGEMLGTIGQTYAFMSKLNPEYSEKAEFYFLKSFKFFIEDSIHQQMSINFLTILAWYCNNLEQAKKYFGMRKNISEGKSLTTWVKAIVVRSENNIGKTFDISILLRLLAIEQIGTKKIIELTEEYIYSMDKIKEHPFELIYKWLGVNYLLQDNYRQSIIYFDKAFDITENGFFTLQTIGISILGLKAIALFKDNKKENAEEVILQLQNITDILMQQSPSFADYIKSIGGTKQMCDDINHYKIIDTAKWLPFAYA